MRTRVSGLGLGAVRGDYPLMTPAVGSTLQVLRGFLLLLWIAMVFLTIFTPDQVGLNLLWTTLVVVAVYTVKFGWRLLTARLGMNRCYLLTDGVAVTNRFGRIRDSVAWSDVTGVQQTAVVGLVSGAHRMEISRNRSPQPLWFVAPGAKAPLADAVLAEGRRAGALQ
ncbi:hypothetical protein [Streptomyces zhihengii]